MRKSVNKNISLHRVRATVYGLNSITSQSAHEWNFFITTNSKKTSYFPKVTPLAKRK